MEIIREIQNWTYPIIDLVLLIYCLIKINSNGSKYFVFGFGILFITSLMWRFVNIFDLYSKYDKIYEVLGHINFIGYIIFAGLFIKGISLFKKSNTFTKEKVMQNNLNVQNESTQNFGSVGFFVVMLLVGIFLFIIGIFSVEGSEDTAIGMFVIGGILLVIAEIYFLVLLYRVWRFAINELHRHNLTPSIETPGRAVGYLFIPFYNFYWVFQAYGKLPKDLNAVAKAKEKTVTISDGLGTSLAILCLLSIIPIVGYVTSVIVIILAPIFISQAINFAKSLS